MTENPDIVNAIRVAKVEAAAHPTPVLTPYEEGLLREIQTPGSVLYGLMSWRSDSVMMAHLLPVFADLMTDAGRAACVDPSDPCSAHWPTERYRWCEGCCLLNIADQVQAVAKP